MFGLLCFEHDVNIANTGLETKEQYPETATVKNNIKINKKEKNMRRYSMNAGKKIVNLQTGMSFIRSGRRRRKATTATKVTTRKQTR